MQPVTEGLNQGRKLVLKILKNPQPETPDFKDLSVGEDIGSKSQQLDIPENEKDIVKEKVLTLKISIPMPPIRYQIDNIMNKPLGTLELDLSKIEHNKALIDFIKKGKEIHGDNIIYSHIDPNIVLQYTTLFELQCYICTYRWWTTKYEFFKSKGCAWCKSQCLNTVKNSLYIIIFVGSRIHDNKYDYSFNDPKSPISNETLLKIWCQKNTHKIFEEKVSKHLSRAKINSKKCSGCPECNKEVEEIKKLLPKEIKKDWQYNLELLKSEGMRIHGNIYDYSLNAPKDILNCMSKIKIKCLQIKNNGNPCLRIFDQILNNHISRKAGCIECAGKLQYNYQIFIQRFDERYPNKPFLLHHIKEEDVVNVDSKLILECSKPGCEYIFENTVGELLNCHVRQCDRCNNREPWTTERLQKECNRRQLEGLYSYSLINFSESINCETLLPIICNRCIYKGYKNVVFEQTVFSHFYSDRNCLRCIGHMPWTPERTKEECELKEKFGQYSYENTDFSNIKGGESILSITCIYCKNEGCEDFIFSQTIACHFIQSHGCLRCGGLLRWTKNRFLVESKKKEKEGLFSYENVDLDSIDNRNTIIPISCCTCKNLGNKLYIFLRRIGEHFNNHQPDCPRCNGKLLWTEERCIVEAEKKSLEGHYSYHFEEFVHVKNGDSEINIDCLFCQKDGYERYTFSYSVKDHFTYNRGCLRCNSRLKWDYNRFLEELPTLPKSFTIYFDYSGIKTHMIENKDSLLPITCLICNNSFRRTVAGHILHHQGCTFCKKSKGEKIIYNYLKMNNIEFDDQIRVLGYDGNYFRYDFVVKYKDKIIIIEYDGEQHFRVIDCWHTEETFNESRKRDIYKQNIALKEDKKVIRIDYSINFNRIEEYLKVALEHSENIYYSTPSLYEWME